MNSNYLAYDVTVLEREFADLLAAYPELAEDEELRADMIEGSTAAFDVLTRLVNIERDADSMSKAVAGRISDLQARKQRAEKRRDMARTLMLRVMHAAGIRKAPLVEATVSVSKRRDSVEIVEEAKLPRDCVKVTVAPDKTAIKARLDAGQAVPGARLKVGEPMITVRAV